MIHRLKPLLVLLLALPALQVQALSFPLPEDGGDLVGEVRTVKTVYEDTLSDIARLNDLGYKEITDANPDVDPWLPGTDTEVILPTHFILPPGPREGVVINLAELRLYYYPKGEKRVITHPLGIGREGWSTPTGRGRITRKQANPTWYPPASIRAEHEADGDPLPAVVKPGPDNPLGKYALYLSLPGYLIHGTHKPYGVGMRVSHGCIRLYPEDIESLFSNIPVGTPVRIINEPYKAGWQSGQLYVEAHPPLSEQLKEKGINFTPMVQAIVKALGDSNTKPDWSGMKRAALKQRGIPTAVTEAQVTAAETERDDRLPQEDLALSGDAQSPGQ
ncbi:MAG: L,D-transpeptidase family protein [Sedimenticola sp.]